MPYLHRVCHEVAFPKDHHQIQSHWLHDVPQTMLTHWVRVTPICVSKLTMIASDKGLSPGRHQAIIWTIAGILLIGYKPMAGVLTCNIHIYQTNMLNSLLESPLITGIFNKLQNRAIRNILGCNKWSHLKPLYASLKNAWYFKYIHVQWANVYVHEIPLSITRYI